MPIPCEFEEDSFQQQLDVEICNLSNFATTGGRVSENILGYDAAFQLKAINIFERLRIFPRRNKKRELLAALKKFDLRENVPSGVELAKELFDNFEKLSKPVPNVKLNLFLQYKVPERMVGSSAAEWQHWGHEYYRYQLRSNQLEILTKLSRKCGDAAIVAYASPAFIELDELIKHAKNHSVIKATNFVEAAMLAGHHTYTYQTALGVGLAHSTVETVEPLELEKEISRRIEILEGSQLAESIQNIADRMRQTCLEEKFHIEIFETGIEDPLQRNLEIIRRFEVVTGCHHYLLG